MITRTVSTSRPAAGTLALLLILVLAGLAGALAAPLAAQDQGTQLDESCVVTVLNRTAQVQPDGTWSIPNAPANTGLVRARATCTRDGVVRTGQSDFFLIPANGAVEVPDIVFGEVQPAPESLQLTASPAVLTEEGATAQLTALASFADGQVLDVTPGATGTSYTVSNPAVATLDANGTVTAVRSGTVVVSALHDGVLGATTLQVQLGGDADGDGIPDELEVELGLDPTNPVDALEDSDGDDLTNREELVDFGTDPRVPDTDGDGLADGEEAFGADDGFVTNPLLADTDGDQLRDGLEIQTGSDPTDPTSFNLAAALESIRVLPGSFVLTVNSLFGEASRQLDVTGTLIDGFPIDLTSTALGTNYLSSDLAVCSFGLADGLLFGGADGTCTVTVTNNGFSATAQVTVKSFSPTALSFVDLPGFGNNVDVAGDLAYVAAGAAGLVVVDVSDREAPQILATADTAGNANDVKVAGDLAFVADGVAGVAIFDVSQPAAPGLVSTLDTPGSAWDLVVRGSLAFVADAGSGLRVIDVAEPAAPVEIGSLATSGSARGVDVTPDVGLAVIAEGGAGVRTVDLTDPTAPVSLGGVDTGDARDVALGDGFAYVADFANSFTAVDLADPAAPVITDRPSLSLGGRLHDVALAGGFGFGADVLFVNGVPILDLRQPGTVVPRDILDFRSFRDDNGTGVAVDSTYVYLTASRSLTENGSSGTTRLYVGQYLKLEDTLGIPPTVEITRPANGSEVIEGSSIVVEVDAEDDFDVAGVELLVDGAPLLQDGSDPFTFTLAVPTDAEQLTLQARAEDLAGNSALSSPVTLAVIPDPGTEVVGLLVDPDGLPLADAAVEVTGGLTTTSLADGSFSIPGVPTVNGDLVVKASKEVGGELLRGTSEPVPPVPGGVTDVGTLTLTGDAVIGYYDLSRNRGVSAQVQPILTAGHEPVDVGDLRSAELAPFDVLFVQNPSNGGYSSIYRGQLDKIFDWIEAGGVLVFHDRHVSGAEAVLPGSPGNIVRNFTDGANVDIVDDTTPVTDGPGGTVDDGSLDGGNFSNHGFVEAGTVPAGARGVLSTGDPDHWVLYAYPFGAGQVVYSTIPLDFYLGGSGPSGVSRRIREVYAPNVLEWANQLR